MVFSTGLTDVVGYPIKFGIERIALRGVAGAGIEMIFGNLALIAGALGTAGLLILYAGRWSAPIAPVTEHIGWREAGWMGAIQGLCLPFRGFSRSGATIFAGLILGAPRKWVEGYVCTCRDSDTAGGRARDQALVHCSTRNPRGKR